MKMESTNFDSKQKIGQLSYEGRQYIEQGTPKEAIECFHKAYELSRQLDDDHLERTCALNLGAAYIDSGKSDDVQEGLKFLHKATPPEGEKDAASNGDLFYNFALGYEALNKLKEAAKYFWSASSEFRTDTDMQIQCLTKCAQLYSKWKNYSKMIEIYEHMCNVYRTQNNAVMQASCLCEIAANHRFANNDREAVKAADDAYGMLVKISQTDDDGAFGRRDLGGKVFNDLGLVYTQLQNYDLACKCFENALPLVRAPSENKQLEAVILQNLGAAYNFRGEYQRAIKFHEDAADAYAKLKSRNNQGQCFTNLAFAYSQLGQFDEADITYNHALLASKDAGDRQTRWQALEGLGCVKFNQRNYEKAENFFLDALRLIPETNVEASERVKQKLAQVMKVALGRQPVGRDSYYTYAQNSMGTMDEERLQQLEGQKIQEPYIVPEQAPVTTAAPMQMGEQFMSSAREIDPSQQQQVLVMQNSPQQRRMIPMRKKDSFGYKLGHEKMMRGLSGTMSSMSNYSYDSPRYVITEQTGGGSQYLRGSTQRGSTLQEETEESTSSSEDDSSEDDSSSEEEEEPTSREEKTERQDGGKKEQEQETMVVEEIFRPKSGSVQKTSPDSRQLPVHRKDKDVDHRQYEKMLLEKEEHEEEESSEDDSEEESEEESGSGDESKPESEGEEEEWGNKFSGQETKEKPPTLPTQSPPHTLGFSSGDIATYVKPRSPQDEEDPYQSINDVTRGTGNFEPVLDEEGRPKGIDDMPRGQREAILQKEHIRRSELGPPLPERTKQEKESRTCVVM